MKKLKLLGVQITVGMDKEENLQKALQRMKEGINEYHPDLIVLPEMFNTPYHNSYFADFSEPEDGPAVKELRMFAKMNQILLIAGSIPERSRSKIYNTSYIFDQFGKILGKHRKVHLFDIDIPGQITFRESEVLTRGDNITVINTSFGKIGVAICYDVRFPELFIEMDKQGAEIIIVPGAFNLTTGPAHWKLLMRSRALDNQAFIMAVSPARDLQAPYHAYGHSMVVDPWGTTLKELDEKEGFLYCEIDLEERLRIRQELPVRKNRRKDLY